MYMFFATDINLNKASSMENLGATRFEKKKKSYFLKCHVPRCMDLLALAVIYIHDDKRQRFRRGKNANVNEPLELINTQLKL